MYFLSEKPLKSGVFANPGHVSSNSISITRGVCGIDNKGERVSVLKTLIYQGFQYTWVRNPLSEEHENIASRIQVHKGTF